MTWKELLRNNITTPAQLAEYLPMTPEDVKEMEEIVVRYPMSITRYYLDLIDKNDPKDPLRLMCVPSWSEEDEGGSFDTSGEKQNTRVEGLQHKYRQTALILSTNRCALYCRHCFRKRLVGLSEEENARRFDKVLDYLRRHEEIDNVLISGGDSFMNSNALLEYYLQNLTAIKHIKLLRFGTRMPVVLPQRINDDPELLCLLSRYAREKSIYVVTQFNHPRELTYEACRAVELLFRSGVRVCNQTVLLRGVNDDPQILAELMNGLAVCGAVPYYLFQCRPVTGVWRQFQVPLLEGCDIVGATRTRLSGMAKRFRFAMSHESGKIEIVGRDGADSVVFKYHQARDINDSERIFRRRLEPGQCWLKDQRPGGLRAFPPKSEMPSALSPENLAEAK